MAVAEVKLVVGSELMDDGGDRTEARKWLEEVIIDDVDEVARDR